MISDKYSLYMGDCLELMKDIPDNSVDMILCDLPYGTTRNKWDSVIPFDLLWGEYGRICSGPVVLTACQPFTSSLVISNTKCFRHNWVWKKKHATGHLNAKRMPMKQHEDVLVFCSRVPTYNPQGLIAYNKVTKRGNNGTNFGKSGRENFQEWTNYPRSVLEFASDANPVHPTQKPVALMEYLIRTYTNAGDAVLDNCMGSGTTGVSCMNTGRKFIGMEMDAGYFEVAKNRIEDACK